MKGKCVDTYIIKSCENKSMSEPCKRRYATRISGIFPLFGIGMRIGHTNQNFRMFYLFFVSFGDDDSDVAGEEGDLFNTGQLVLCENGQMLNLQTSIAGNICRVIPVHMFFQFSPSSRCTSGMLFRDILARLICRFRE